MTTSTPWAPRLAQCPGHGAVARILESVPDAGFIKARSPVGMRRTGDRWHIGRIRSWLPVRHSISPPAYVPVTHRLERKSSRGAPSGNTSIACPTARLSGARPVSRASPGQNSVWRGPRTAAAPEDRDRAAARSRGTVTERRDRARRPPAGSAVWGRPAAGPLALTSTSILKYESYQAALSSL
jgi:hypothetical protein